MKLVIFELVLYEICIFLHAIELEKLMTMKLLYLAENSIILVSLAWPAVH